MYVDRSFGDRAPSSHRQQLVDANLLLVAAFALAGLLVSVLAAIHFPTLATTLAGIVTGTAL